MKIIKAISLIAAAAALVLMLPGCAGTGHGETVGAPVDPTDESRETSEAFAVTDSNNILKEGNTYTVVSSGRYTFSGKLEDGNIVVNAGEDDKVELILNGITVSSSESAPVSVISADKVTVNAANGSYNVLRDLRSEDGSDENAALFADCDLEIEGNGTLIVESQAYGGIKTKDDLTVSEAAVKVTSAGDAVRGNDSVALESGSLILISNGADGIATANSGISSGGKQKGGVTISEALTDVNAASDGIDAEYDIDISGGALKIVCGDDGLHAEGSVTISGGDIEISESHEAIEANVITISGGNTVVSGNDDGINATRGAVSPMIDISGGYLEVSAPDGDTDAIDSNGDINVSGGTVLIKSRTDENSLSGSVDADGALTVSGGTVIALGKIADAPSDGSTGIYLSDGRTIGAGGYSIVGEDGKTVINFAVDGDYSLGWICSDKLQSGENYKLISGEVTAAEWTQQ
ncbi:MAG: carbohydrate-binding domain-containing protein [Clostridia bacterium]|nr:carbohydrate-binding domain-containing protein [Clostridia bacterium]